MKRVGRWIVTTMGTALIVVSVLGIGAAFAQEPESTPTPAPETTTPEEAPRTSDLPMRDGPKGRHGRVGGDDEALASALGVTMEALEAAEQEAFAASLQQAVEQGALTQEEADQLLSGERGGRFHPHGPRERGSDYQELLADALGISVTELEAVTEQVRAAALADAVAEGRITQEQADLIQARQAVEAYLDHKSILAQALGMSVEELEAAKAAGQRPDEIAETSGLDREALHVALQSAQEAAISQAVSDGMITQAQADQLLSGEGMRGFGGRGGHGRGFGRPGFDRPERGGSGEDAQSAPSVTPSSDT